MTKNFVNRLFIDFTRICFIIQTIINTLYLKRSSPTSCENKSIARAASSSNLAGRRFSSISPEDLATFNANRKDRRGSALNLDLNFNQLNKRRHSSINPNDIKRVANKVSRAADDLIMSTTEKIVVRYKTRFRKTVNQLCQANLFFLKFI